jgi:lipoate-protein ligase A
LSLRELGDEAQSPAHTVRLLIDPPLEGATNMARDEALLQRVGRKEAPPTLRVYQWDPATLSLGYFQSYAELREQPKAIRSMPVVRRLTGGGAIVHEQELTYSLALPAEHPLLQRGPLQLYELVHDAVIAMLAERGIKAGRAGCQQPCSSQHGPFLCFERRHPLDVVVDDRKVLGSAQRRTAEAILQHGSLQLGSLLLAGNGRYEPDELSGPFINVLAKKIGASFGPSKWHEDTLALAHDLFDKYAGTEWTRQR